MLCKHAVISPKSLNRRLLTVQTPSPCSTSSSLRSFNASRDDSKAKKPKIPTAERQNFNCRELSRLGVAQKGSTTATDMGRTSSRGFGNYLFSIETIKIVVATRSDRVL